MRTVRSLRASGRLRVAAAQCKSLLTSYLSPLSRRDHVRAQPTVCRRSYAATATAHSSPPSTPPTTPPLTSHLSSSPSASTPQSARPTLRLLRLHLPILEQLRIEEALLRLSPHSYLVLNTQPHVHPPSIVLGISGRPELWLNIPEVRRRGVQCVRRFTGGGTVYCDRNTFFITLLLARAAVPNLQPYPQPLLHYTAELYAPVFGRLGGERADGFNVRGNDYCFGDRKFAGNAQSITRDKLLHHTSFLHAVDTQALQQLLAMPPEARRPAYRADRPHGDFVTSVQQWLARGAGGREKGVEAVVDWLGEELAAEMRGRGWDVVEESEVEARQWMAGKYDRVLKVIDWDEEMARIKRERAEKLAKEQAAAG